MSSSNVDTMASTPKASAQTEVVIRRCQLPRLTARPRRPIHALFVGTHPVQYSAPIFRRLAQHPQLEIQVAYCGMQGAELKLDPGFGIDAEMGRAAPRRLRMGCAAEPLSSSEIGFVFRVVQSRNLAAYFEGQIRRRNTIHGLHVREFMDRTRCCEMESDSDPVRH